VRATLPDLRMGEPALAEVRAKHPTPEALRTRLTRLRHGWPALREALRAQLLRPDELAAMLRAAGSPADSSEIGVSPAQARASIPAARLIRRRYTVLDLAAEAGVLDECVAEIA
jgi:glycerol-1-phosphate dehydrogenase [NAD(P)+]